MYNPQFAIDRINNQMSELERQKAQLQQMTVQPITQNFQLAPTAEVIKYAESLDEVKRNIVIGDTPYFSKDMSILWVKNTKGEIKTYELSELVQKDEKDLKIEFLIAEIEELKKGRNNELTNVKQNDTNDATTTKNE